MNTGYGKSSIKDVATLDQENNNIEGEGKETKKNSHLKRRYGKLYGIWIGWGKDVTGKEEGKWITYELQRVART